MSKGLILLLEGSRGIYIPRDFMAEMDLSQWDGISLDDISICSDPDHEAYWDAWEQVCDNATHTDSEGNIWHLWQDGDLWMYCDELMSPLEKHDFWEHYQEGACPICCPERIDDAAKTLQFL